MGLGEDDFLLAIFQRTRAQIVAVYWPGEKRSNAVSELYPTGRAALRDDVHINALEGGKDGRVAPSKAYNTHLSEKHRVQRYTRRSL